MKSYFPLSIILASFILSSCSEDVVHIQKHYSTYSTATGDIIATDEIIATIEWQKTSTLSFRNNGILVDLYVRAGERVKKWQILARLGNNESSIQVSGLLNIQQELDKLSFTTNSIQFQTEWLKDTTEKLYNTRLESLETNLKTLELNIEKAKQNLGNQKSGLKSSFTTFANDFDRIASSILFEWDRILGITTNFEYTNDGWEPYLWARAGSSQVEAKNLWNALYTARGTIRKYTQSGSEISDIIKVSEELRLAYIQARNYTQSMSYMFENSVLGKDLSQERLDGWINAWKGFSADEQWSESNYITWMNTSKSLVSNSGSGTVADKDISSLELELENLKLSKATLMREKEAKLQEIKTNVDTVQWKKGEVRLKSEENKLNTNLAQASKEYTIIRAPFDGTILEKYMDEWGFVWAGQWVIQITSNEQKIIKTYIENTIYEYKIWDTLELVNEENQTLTGTITLIQEQKDPLHNKNYTEISLQWDGTIGSKVTIHLSRKKSQLLHGTIIPLSAIITKYGPPWVYILDDNTARYQFVELIHSDMSHAEVLGIPQWSMIITEGKENIYDGEKLE
jgi:multidrug efflux pump subunit AcrA (membrane-fusion protein)